MKPMIGIVVAVATATLLAPTPPRRRTRVPAGRMRTGNQPVSQNFGSPTGGASRIDGPIGGTGGNAAPTRPPPGTCGCRRGMSAFPKCEVWQESAADGVDEAPTAVGCYILPTQGQR